MAEYFGQKAAESIMKYLSVDTQTEKNQVFEEEIRPVFDKLIQGLIFTYKFQKLDDIDTMKAECLTHLYEMLPKFDPSRGTKPFSYFNVVARNWFIGKSKDIKKREKNESDLLCGLDYEKFRHNQSIISKPFEEDVVDKEFWLAFSSEMERWRDEMPLRAQERAVLDAIIFFFQNSEIISICNKKAIQIYIRDVTNLNLKQIATSLKKLREMYIEFKRRYDNGFADAD